MTHFSRRTKILVAFLVVLFGGTVVTYLAGRANGRIPSEFTESRLQGALIAQNIVKLSNESVRDLETIGKLDRERNYDEALNIAVLAVVRSQKIRSEAIKLSEELEKMTRALSGIDSQEARQAAYESISARLALLSRLINYSGYLGEILDALKGRFTGKIPPTDLTPLVGQINLEIAAINDLNRRASEAMDRFDDIVRQ